MVDKGTVSVDYDLALSALSKRLAINMLEYLFRPTLEAFYRTASFLRELAEETLYYHLFACLYSQVTIQPDRMSSSSTKLLEYAWLDDWTHTVLLYQNPFGLRLVEPV